jgi:hypothetical protein
MKHLNKITHYFSVSKDSVKKETTSPPKNTTKKNQAFGENWISTNCPWSICGFISAGWQSHRFTCGYFHFTPLSPITCPVVPDDSEVSRGQLASGGEN